MQLADQVESEGHAILWDTGGSDAARRPGTVPWKFRNRQRYH